MTLIDLAIFALLALFAVAGYHKAFLKAVLSIASYFVSLLGASWVSSQLAQTVKASGKVIPLIVHYSESSAMLDSIESFRSVATELSPEALNEIVGKSSIPYPLSELLVQNVQNAAFSQDGLITLGDYLSMTIAHMAVNLFSFIVIFMCFYIVFSLLINLYDYVFKFPVLKLFDNASGALLGFIQGFLIMFLIFSIVPVVLAFLPFQEISDLIESSSIGKFYYHSNFIIDMIKGIIK
jgi:uncharacterized membrane protein required for colicin V production